MRYSIKVLAVLLFAVLLNSCSLFVKRDQYILWRDVSKDPKAIMELESMNTDSLTNSSVKIMPFDVLDIRLVQTTEGFTKILQATAEGIATSNTPQGGGGASGYLSGFLVDQEGNINYPVIGKVAVRGLSIIEARDAIKVRISEYMLDPFIEVKFLSFKVTILGAVNKPGTYTIPNERANIIEVLGLAGDINEFANINNIRVVRGDPKNPTILYINLSLISSIGKPGYALMPNDVIYIEPTKRKFTLANLELTTIFLSFVNLAVVVATLIISARR
ncbi:MAG: polysaccharide biosynthesis/export family protein [Bacteroidota bacterium]|nr:polysaccharide biosynthesis/export family protein [Bacteroidota bacterium]